MRPAAPASTRRIGATINRCSLGFSYLCEGALPVSLSFLIGAILGSFIAIVGGREPARKLIAVVQDRYYRPRR